MIKTDLAQNGYRPCPICPRRWPILTAPPAAPRILLGGLKITLIPLIYGAGSPYYAFFRYDFFRNANIETISRNQNGNIRTMISQLPLHSLLTGKNM